MLIFLLMIIIVQINGSPRDKLSRDLKIGRHTSQNTS